MLLDALLDHVRAQRLVRRLIGHRTDRGHADAVAAMLDGMLAAPRQLHHGVPHALRGLAGGVCIVRVWGGDDVDQIGEVDAGQVPRPARHAQPGVGVMQGLAVGGLARLLLIIGGARFDFGRDLRSIRRRGRGLSLGVVQLDVHQVRVPAGWEHLLPGYLAK